jgi:hypothetical protein
LVPKGFDFAIAVGDARYEYSLFAIHFCAKVPSSVVARENVVRRAGDAALADAFELGNAPLGGGACPKRRHNWTYGGLSGEGRSKH